MAKILKKIKDNYIDYIQTIGFWSILIIAMNGFLEYYYWHKLVNKKTAKEIEDEVIKYPQDMFNILFYTMCNYFILYGLWWLIW